jgi:hypothetical protein
MASVSITMTGMGRVKSLLGNVAAAAVRVNGPIISLTSDAPYARFVEEGARGRPPRRMFRDGINAVRPKIGPTLGPAILRGVAAVDAAKRQLQAQAVEEVRRRTPVRTGRLRASVHASGRPG